MIELRRGDIKAILDIHGAWLTNLADGMGDILFPKRVFSIGSGTKVRGGCHVCLPNFGPGGLSGQVQHGFGRDVVWSLEDTGENYALLQLSEGPGEYKDLTSTLSYILEESQIEMILELTNNGSNNLRVAPGFHPYFALPSNERPVKLDGKSVELKEIAEVRFSIGEEHKLQTPQRYLSLQSENLSTWGYWTDSLGAYICIEPSADGFSFLNAKANKDELLTPKTNRTYSFTISWKPTA